MHRNVGFFCRLCASYFSQRGTSLQTKAHCNQESMQNLKPMESKTSLHKNNSRCMTALSRKCCRLGTITTSDCIEDFLFFDGYPRQSVLA